MRKSIIFGFAFILVISMAYAKPITPETAQWVAQNFYKQNSKIELKTITLVYTEFADDGSPLYYAFNCNSNDGFVLVSGEMAGQPIIGYSTENKFVVPATGTTIGTWLKKRGEEITYIRANGLKADEKINAAWKKYMPLNKSNERQNNNYSVQTVSPLMQTTWNQSPYYNDLCPGGSVTGCVATAMSQIMKYWSYPTMGTGSSSYCDCTSQGMSQNYGTLSANYGATTYNWANMPLSLGGSNNDVATIMFQTGVSVHMNYSPSVSGAWVIASDNPICAQNSYVTYFGYDPGSIQGLKRSNFTDPNWITTLEADLNIGRVIQYAGWDPNNGGHTWVCDGYDQNDFLHMNWGWGGYSNGYFALTSMNPGSDNFVNKHEAITGIVPLAVAANDASVSSIVSPAGFYCTTSQAASVKLQNYGSGNLSSCVINYKVDNNTPQTFNWSGNLVTGQSIIVSLPGVTSTAGTHTLTAWSSNPNGGSDGNPSNDLSVTPFSVSLAAALPVVEGFESITLPSADFNIMNTGNGNNWTVTSTAAATGSNSAMIDNSANPAGSSSILQTVSNYDMTTMNAPTLSFSMAYQQKATSNNDNLHVYSSVDCGATWMSRWARVGGALSTVSGTSASPFVPTPSQFTNYQVNINGLSNNTSVMFRWVFNADPMGPGNNIYVDDINIYDASVGIRQIAATEELNIYPNPSSGSANLSVTLPEKHLVSVEVTDMLGRPVESIDAKAFNAGETNLQIGARNKYNAGIYFVKIDIDGKKLVKKICME